jgi:hypothetical protein
MIKVQRNTKKRIIFLYSNGRYARYVPELNISRNPKEGIIKGWNTMEMILAALSIL